MSGRNSWRFIDGVLLMILVGLAVFAALSIWEELFLTGWRDEEQSHILLAPIVVGWLVWVRRERARDCRVQWNAYGAIVIALGWVLARVGFEQGHDLFRHTGAITMAFGAALAVVGPRTVIRFLPAVVAMGFLLPVPGRIRHGIAHPLQEATAVATTALLELFGLPVTRDGNVMNINGHQVAVAEACNGMRMVAALGLVSYAFVFSTPMRASVRVTILILSPAVALLVNIIRMVPTALFYGYASLSAANLFHDASGWFMLFVALGLLWAFVGLLKWIEVPVEPYPVKAR